MIIGDAPRSDRSPNMIEISTTKLHADAEALRHRQKMEKRKAAQDAEVASKTITQKGLLIVHTGKGKGKSTAAFGLLLRALGHEWRCGVVQFVKGAWDTGERNAIRRFEGLVDWLSLGDAGSRP